MGRTCSLRLAPAAAGSVGGLRRLMTVAAAAVGLCGLALTASAQNWQLVGLAPVGADGSWQTMASSTDGATLVVAGGAAFGVSTNWGASWSISSPLSTNLWASVACSADGSKIYLASYDSPALGPIAVSTNAGATWAPSGAPMEDWSITPGSIACSSDGNTVVAATGFGSGGGGALFVSTNGGSSWFETGATNQYWSSVACSADGTKMAAASADVGGSSVTGGLFTSTNSGSSWTRTSAPTNNWMSVASSSDGIKLVAAAGGAVPRFPGYDTGVIFTSTNSGVTWTQTSAPTNNWLQVVSSADGSKLAALTGDQLEWQTSFWISTNFGATWTASWPLADGGASLATTISADGSRLVAVSGGRFWVSQPPPPLALAQSSSGLSLAWPASAPGFTVQESLDVTATNWATLTNAPAITGSQYQVEIPQTSGNTVFYRLKSQ